MTTMINSGIVKKYVAPKPKQRKRRDNPEDRLQTACVQWLRLQFKDKLFYFHCPNGGKRTKAEAAMFKRLGVKAGVPDLLFLDSFLLPNDCAPFKGLAIEFKTRGCKANVSKEQKECIFKLQQRDFRCEVIDTLCDFIQIIFKCYGHLL